MDSNPTKPHRRPPHAPSLKDTLQLAIETTGRTGSIAVLSGERVLRQCNFESNTRTAAAMAPEIDRILRWCEAKHHTLGFVSVADGPGSFTGLRIGVTTAKTLAYALGLPLIGVDSLAAIAAAILHEHATVDTVLVGINAYRGQVFSGSFSRASLLPRPEQLLSDPSLAQAWTAHPDSVCICEDEQWQQILRSRPEGITLAGDSLPFGELAEAMLHRPCDAVGAGLLALRSASCNDWSDPFSLVPRYLKASAAEEKAALK